MARAKRSPAGVRHRDLGASPSRPAILRAQNGAFGAGNEVLNRPGSTRKTPGSVTDFFHLRRSLDVAKSLSEETYTNHDRNSTYSPTTKHIRRRGSDPSSEPSSRVAEMGRTPCPRQRRALPSLTHITHASTEEINLHRAARPLTRFRSPPAAQHVVCGPPRMARPARSTPLIEPGETTSCHRLAARSRARYPCPCQSKCRCCCSCVPLDAQ